MRSIILTILFPVIIFIWLRYEISKSSRKTEENSSSFWKREQESNFVRKKDISNLNYLSIPVKTLPFHTDNTDEALKELEEQIHILSQSPILNLSHMSNTDIKLKYGTANLELLSSYDQNYLLLIRTLYEWANLLYEKNLIKDAQTVLEFGIECNSDITGNYTLLANIYKEQNDYISIKNLIKNAEQLNSLMKNVIIKKLNNILTQ